MACEVILCYITLWCLVAILVGYYITLWRVKLFCVTLRCGALCSEMSCHVMLCFVGWCCVVPDCVELCYDMCCVALCYVVLCFLLPNRNDERCSAVDSSDDLCYPLDTAVVLPRAATPPSSAPLTTADGTVAHAGTGNALQSFHHFSSPCNV